MNNFLAYVIIMTLYYLLFTAFRKSFKKLNVFSAQTNLIVIYIKKIKHIYIHGQES